MRSMQWQLGILGTISALAYRHRETKKNLCRGGRSQDLPNTDFQPAVRHYKNKVPAPCTGQEVLNQFSFGHVDHRFPAGIVKRSVQCHVILPVTRRSHSSTKYPVNISVQTTHRTVFSSLSAFQRHCKGHHILKMWIESSKFRSTKP